MPRPKKNPGEAPKNPPIDIVTSDFLPDSLTGERDLSCCMLSKPIIIEVIKEYYKKGEIYKKVIKKYS